MINKNYERLLLLRHDKMAELYFKQSNKKEYVQLPFDERMAILIDAQLEENKKRSIELLRRKATIRIPQADINDLYYYPERKIDKILTLKLHECDFIYEKLNIIVTGATGAGKTFYVSALANSAIDKGIRVRYIRLPDLLYSLDSCKDNPKSFQRKMKTFQNIELLILDDFLITPLNQAQASIVFELLENRSDIHSTILASQFETPFWHERLGSGAVADAIMDRIIHNSYIIDIKGDRSMRERTSKIKNQ